MRVIDARNINDAFIQGMRLLTQEGVLQDSRAGKVLVMDTPVTTVYKNPTERVLFHVGRDANPFFHLMEALWMLAGRNDATWLDQFVRDFSARFAEEGGALHGAYGFRWRRHFDVEGGGRESLPDQLETIVRLLKENPDDRRIVLQMWDPVADLDVRKKDIPCNTQAYFRVRGARADRWPDGVTITAERRVLDMTVCCRSNDAVWGAYGANAVHFSVLQEYIAARVGVLVGTYAQMSNNFHVYTDVLKRIDLWRGGGDLYKGETSANVRATPLINDPEAFDSDLRQFMSGAVVEYKNEFFPSVAYPMQRAYGLWRDRQYSAAQKMLFEMPPLCDWRVAAGAWFARRMSLGDDQKEGKIWEGVG